MENTGKKESYFLTAYLCNQFTPVRPLPDRGFLSCGACGTCGVWQNRERRLSCLSCGPCKGVERAFYGQKAEKFHIKDAFCDFHGTLDSRKSTS